MRMPLTTLELRAPRSTTATPATPRMSSEVSRLFCCELASPYTPQMLYGTASMSYSRPCAVTHTQSIPVGGLPGDSPIAHPAGGPPYEQAGAVAGSPHTPHL